MNLICKIHYYVRGVVCNYDTLEVFYNYSLPIRKEKCCIQNISTTLSQQIIGGKLLLILI